MKEMKNKRGNTIFGGVGIALLLCLLMIMMPFASTVSNGDTTDESTTETNSERTSIEETTLEGSADSTFNAEEYGYDADYEMLGMRDQNSKVFIGDDGGMDMIYSSEPLHYLNADNKWSEIDLTIDSTSTGYEVVETSSPIQFESDAQGGYSALFGGDLEIVSGVNSMVVVIDEQTPHVEGELNSHASAASLASDSKTKTDIEINPLYFETSKNVLTGGNKISYPLSDSIDLTYVVKQDEVKQELVIKSLPATYQDMPQFINSDYIGLYETFSIPAGHHMVSESGIALTGMDLFQTNQDVSIVNTVTNVVVAYIEAPVSHDSTNGDDPSEIPSTYFLSVDEFGTSGSIITAIPTSSLLSDDVKFPVHIDPTFVYVATGENNYLVCDISANDCHSKSNGRYEYDNYGDMEDSPRFPFTFGATQPDGNALTPVEGITAKVYYDGDYDKGWADIIVLEDCGYPATGGPTGDVQLGGLSNINGCTGNPLPAYSPPTASGNPVYTYDVPTSESRMYQTYGYVPPQYSWQTGYYGVNNHYHHGHFGTFPGDSNHGAYVSASDGSAANGVWSTGNTAKTYQWTATDSYGDGMNSNAKYRIMIDNTPNNNNLQGINGWTTLATVSTSGSSSTGTFTVPANKDFTIRYQCPQSSLSSCYPNENLLTIQELVATTVSLPELTSGGNGPGNNAPQASISLPNGDEARMIWECGGWCEENEIYWREAGQSWTTSQMWAPAPSGASNGAIFSSNTAGVLIQNAVGSTMNLEFLVVDTYGDGTNGGSGDVEVDVIGTWGTAPETPWGLRQVSMMSSDSLGLLVVPSTGSTGTESISLCNTEATCNDQSSSISMLTDTIASGGYIEMGLGFGNRPCQVSASPDCLSSSGARSVGGEFYVDKFELIIDFQAITNDQTPPADMTTAHYQGDTYIKGPRTLTLEIEDSEHAIDTTTANGPKLWYSIDNSPYISTSAELVSSTCATKEQTCMFTATTQHLNTDDVVSYYWSYRDVSAPTSLKPTQGPNAGQSATMQFTILDPINAGTSQKLTTLVENVLGAYDSGSKYGNSHSIDRQMTYYSDTNEYLFEFDTSDCDSFTSAQASCFSTQNNDDFGHWDLLWQDTTNACAPGASGCTGTADNSLELDKASGGLFEISRQTGAGANLAFKYDSTAGVWIAVGVGDGSNGLSIQDKLDSNAPSTITQINGVDPVAGTSQLIGSYSGYGGSSGASATTTTIPAGVTGAQLQYDCGSWCTETTIYINGVSWSPSTGSNGIFYRSISPGSYTIYSTDAYGDGPNGGVLNLIIPAPDSQTAHTQSGDAWNNWGFTIDLNNLPAEANTLTGSFGEIALGANDANIICVTTNGLVYFMETTSTPCTADVSASADGGEWQGFALGATVQGEQPNGEGMLWSIRNIAPDPDITAPSIVHSAMGDSHSVNRKVSAVISDPGYQPTGLEVSPNVGLGPTLHYEVYKTATGPTGTTTSVTMAPEGDRTLCAEMECTWSADLPELDNERDESVDYYITAQDTSLAGPNGGANEATTSTATFSVGLPTNTLVIEWQNYASDFAGNNKCSFQTILYDVTNEFEFHYDSTCSSDEVVGVIGHRYDSGDAVTIANMVDSSQSGNPHTSNIRVTVGADGYAYEYFDIGISSPLPLASSTPAIAAGTSTSFRTKDCVNQFWSTLSTFCAGNFDIPSGFTFEFYGDSFDGDNGFADRIHVSAAGVMNLQQNQPASVGAVNYYDAATGITTDAGRVPTQGSSWSGAMYDMNSGSSYYKDYSIAPWWSPASNDRCVQSNGCGGVWYRTIPFEGQGLPQVDDIVEDTVWYLVDSPIRVNPSSPTGYLSVNANLEIEPGVEVIIAEGRGISFDSGDDSSGACTQFTIGSTSSTERVTFNADQTNAIGNNPALWHGISFTEDCSDTTGRHVLANVDISNTEYAAITAGSRPADKLDGTTQDAQYSCGNSQTDCNVGEFDMSGMTFTNVDTAFAHGSGQGTVMSMSNFAINGARSACFNFAENTIATLLGTPTTPSTMTDCNSDEKDWGGAIVSEPGSTAGSLTMSNIDITDSMLTLIRVDFKTVVISNVDATNTASQNPADVAGTWAGDNSGVSLGLSHASGASVDISDFSAPGYHHGWIYAAGSVSLVDVDLGSGWANDHYFDIKPFGSSGTTAGATGNDAIFDNFQVATLYMHRTFPGTFNDISVAGVLNFYGLGTQQTETIEMTGTSVIGGEVGVDGCGSNLKITGATIGGIWSSCTFGNTNVIELTETTINHNIPGTSAVSLALTKAVMIEVDVQSTVIDGTSSWYAFVRPGSELFLVASTYTDVTNNPSTPLDCAANTGSTSNCAINFNTGVGTSASEVYYGGYANALAYRLGVVNGIPQQQILQSDVSITTQTLDSLGNVIVEDIGSAVTGSNPMGETSKVVVITGNQAGEIFTEHIVRATGSAGIGDVKPGDTIMFSNGASQAPGTLFTDYNIGSYVDIRLIAPPVTFDSPNMDCDWMMNTNSTFMNAWDAGKNSFVFKGAALTIGNNMLFDGCSIELEGSKMFFKSGTVTLTTDALGVNSATLLMTIDGDTGDDPEILGENGADVVDFAVSLGGTLNMQAGSIEDMEISGNKAGLLVIESGGNLIMAGNSQIRGSDLTGMAADYPIVLAQGGNVQITTGQISGVGNTGTGLQAIDGFVDATDLTITNANYGVYAVNSALSLDSYTSNDNFKGVVASGAKTLPKIYRSATLQGIDPLTMDACILSAAYACSQWVTYSVDFSTYIGETDFLQPGMDLQYGGHHYDPWAFVDVPYITLDNLKVTMTDNLGQAWTVDSSDDPGYYPYGAGDPASGTTATTYAGGIGGVPSWDCNYQGETYSPYSSYSTLGSWNYAGPGSMADYFGSGISGFPSEFGFRWTGSNNPNSPADYAPFFNWGIAHNEYTADPFWAPYLTNYPSAFYSGARGQTVDICGAMAQLSLPYAPITTPGSSAILNFPVVDISTPGLTSVKMEFDMWHNFDGAFPWSHNDLYDNAQVLARGTNSPSAMGDWSTTLPNNGITIDNSNINNANIGVELLGDTVAEFTNTVISNPSSFGVSTTNDNTVIFDGLDVQDTTSLGLTNYGFYSDSTSSGAVKILNSDFTGLDTALYFNNPVGTTVDSTTLSDGVTGLKIGSSSTANYQLMNLAISDMDVGVDAAGTGKLTVNDCVFTTISTYDIKLSESRNAEFVDGSFSVKPLDDSSKVSVTGSGMLERSRSYFTTLEADGAPVANANVILSSRDASVFSAGTTDQFGISSGLTFSVFTLDDANGINDLTTYFNSYQLTTVAQIGTYSYTDASTNSGDFRYKITSPSLSDDPYDSATGVNYETNALTDVVDIRICSDDNSHTVIAPCAVGTSPFTAADTRTYNTGMVEYGSDESIFNSATNTVDLSNKVIMSDTGVFELRDGTDYFFDDSTIIMTGYSSIYNIGSWVVEQPYGTVFSMDGGSVLGVFPESASGAPVGFTLGGLAGISDSPLSFNVNDVDFSGIASISAYAGDRATSPSWTGVSAYDVGQFSITNSNFAHFRGFMPEFGNSISTLDACIRVAGGTGGMIQGNTFTDCTVGIIFDHSDWLDDNSNPNTGSTDDRYTQTPHPQNGSKTYTVDNNQFTGAGGINIWAYQESNADQLTISNNDMNCNSCIAHILFDDNTSVAPQITGNTIRNGDYAIYSAGVQLAKIESNVISDITTSAIYIDGGDADIIGNTITDSMGAIRVDGITEPTEQVIYLVAGINSGVAQSTSSPFSFRNFVGGSYSDVIQVTIGQGEELIMDYRCVNWCSESRIEYKLPGQNYQTWNPQGSSKDSTSAGLIFSTPGLYKFRMYDTYGDGPNGCGFDVLQGAVGTWAAGNSGGPTNILSWTHNTLHSSSAVGTGSNDDGVVIENLGASPVTWAFRMTDTWGDGANGNEYIIEEAPAGTWSGTSGPVGVYVGGINDGIGPSFTSGTESDWIEIILQPNKELRMVWDDCNIFCTESGMEYGEMPVSAPTTWTGPDIHNNVITNTNFEPNAYGIRIENCDMNLYTISTISNIVTIGQDALVADSCTWIDQGSTLTGTDEVGSTGFNDDNLYGASVVLSSTTISGFETGIRKTSGDLTILSGSSISTNVATPTAAAVHTNDIDVEVKDSTLDGGVSGMSSLIEDSSSATFENVDTSGAFGPTFIGSEFTWTDGTVSNSNTGLVVEDSTGDLVSLIFTGVGMQISASDESYVNSIDYSLDETKMSVSSTSIVDESNWLTIDTIHSGGDSSAATYPAPANEVGLMITDASGNVDAYTSPIFNAESPMNNIVLDGSNDDWFGGNELNPSGYAMPGEISTDFFVTASSTTLYMAFNGVTSSDDLYVYFNTNDLAGSETDINSEHTLPFGAEQALVVSAAGNSIYSSALTGWQPSASAVQVDTSTSFVEISMPLSALGSGIENVDIVSTVQVGTDITVAHPTQQMLATTGIATLTDSYSMNLGLLDMNDGTLTNQVMLYRSFFKSSTPTTGHTYDIMVKTPAAAGQTCDYDWSTLSSEGLSPLLMDQSHTVSFDILRACPKITSSLTDVSVIEIQPGYESSSIHDFVLSTFVDDEQDVEATMKWDVASSNLVAHSNILTDWADVTDIDGTLTVTPINDQFGTFDLEFVVIDSHGQTASKDITFTVTNVNDAPVICDKVADVNCDNGIIKLYEDGVVDNLLVEGFAPYQKQLGELYNDTGNSFVRDMANENNFPQTAQVYTWSASAVDVNGEICDQFSDVKVITDSFGNQKISISEDVTWEQGGICDITLELEDDGIEFCFDTVANSEVTAKPESDTQADCEAAGYVWLGENTANSVTVPFAVLPDNDAPQILDDTVYNNNNGIIVTSTDSSVTWVADGPDYKVTMVEDTTQADTLTFDLSLIKADIDHLPADLSWTLTDTEDCDSSDFYTHEINGDILEFTLIPDATTNAPTWEVDMLNNNGKHQMKPTNAGNCPMTLSLYDDYDDYLLEDAAAEAGTIHLSEHPRWNTNYSLVADSYVPLKVEVNLYVTIDNVKENVPDYEFRADSGFNFNSVTNIMPGTYVPVDFTIFSSTTTGDEGPYTYEKLLRVTVHSDGHDELERSVYYTPPAYGESLFIDDWQVYISDTTTEVWVEMDVLTCIPNSGACTPAVKVLQEPPGTAPDAHLSAVGTNPNPWSEPGKSASNRAPAFEDRNWCNNLMSTNSIASDTPLSSVVLQSSCQHTSDSYIAEESGFSAVQWQNTGQDLPTVVGTIGALSVASFAPSLIAVCLTGLFVSVLVFSSRREDDEEDYEAQVLSDDETAVSPVIATILMVAITVVLSGVVYVWAAQLADTDTKGVPIVTFSAENVDSGSTDTDHWKIVVGKTGSPLATQAIEVSVLYIDAAGDFQTVIVNLGSSSQVYGFTPYNSPDSVVTFSDLVDDSNPDEPVSSFSAGDEIYVRTHIDGHPLVDAKVSITYSPPVGQGALLKTYSGLTWNQGVY